MLFCFCHSIKTRQFSGNITWAFLLELPKLPEFQLKLPLSCSQKIGRKTYRGVTFSIIKKNIFFSLSNKTFKGFLEKKNYMYVHMYISSPKENSPSYEYFQFSKNHNSVKFAVGKLVIYKKKKFDFCFFRKKN